MNIISLFEKDRTLSIVGRFSYGQVRSAHVCNKFNIIVKRLNSWLVFNKLNFDALKERIMFRNE